MRVDFVVKFNPETETGDDLTKKILNSLVIRRLQSNKPVIWYIGGDSGEGKSLTVLKLQQTLLELQGLSMKEYVNDINVYTPIEYPIKFDAILGLSGTKEQNKRLKKINMIAIHEAREIVKAKMWYSFLNQAIGDINAMSRSIKRMCIFIVSQFIRDISTDIRYTITIYSKVFRPRGKRARLYINMMYKDDSDLEKPKLKKRRLTGYIIYPNGRYRKYTPKYLELGKPDEDIIKSFEDKDREAKSIIIRKKIDRLIKEMKVELETDNTKVLAMINYYSQHLENLNLIGKRKGKKFIVNPEIKLIHDLSDMETREFQEKLNEKLRTMKITSREEKEQIEGINEEVLE